MALPVLQPTFTLALTGASGMPIGLRLLDCLIAAHYRVHLLISPAAYFVAKDECGLTLPSSPQKAQDFFSERYRAAQDQLHVFGHHDWYAPVASGTNVADAMVICPCTMGTLAAIAGGMSDNLIERAADVSIKERKPLILVPRETPLSALHLENMLKLARLGVTILPPMPGFYHQPKSIDDLIDFVVARILDALAVPHQLIPRWGNATTAAHLPKASSQRC